MRMEMAIARRRLFFLVLLSVFFISSAQGLSVSQTATFFHIRRMLEYPPAMDGWNKATDLCALPKTGFLSITCSGNLVTELSVSGAGRRLSDNFSIDSLFTTLSRFPNLTVLSLTSVGLWGPIPGKLTRLHFLQTLNLSSNFISGKIPPEISRMKTLASISLAGNRVNGTVPAFIFSLPSLRLLDLSSNLLTGELPSSLSCSQSLAVVDLSRNRLVGSLPLCISINSSSMAVLVSGNCLSSGDPTYQRPSSSCTEGAIAATITSGADEKTGSRSGHKLGFILAVVGGAVGGAVILGVALALIIVLKKTSSSRVSVAGGDTKPAAIAGGGGGSGTTAVWASPRLAADERRTPLTGGSNTAPRVFTIDELEEATNNFDAANLVLDTSMRQVYRGKTQDGSTVAVARMRTSPKSSSPQQIFQFVDVVSRLQHPHLCSVIGHCVGGAAAAGGSSAVDFVFVVLEQPCNGTLRSHLTEWRKREVFKWPQRVAAAVGVARGIRFLHTVTSPGISGNDLSLEKVLVDHTLTVKIGGYNFPTLSGGCKSTNSKGASESPMSLFGDSSYARIQNVEDGEKEDIYQLGFILLELITGEPADKREKLAALKTRLEKALAEEDDGSALHEMTDPTIRGTFAVDSVRTVAELALSCASDDLRRRPPIDDVLWNLQYAAQVQDSGATEFSSL